MNHSLSVHSSMSTLQFFPVYPLWQVHSYPPITSLKEQVPPFWHGEGLHGDNLHKFDPDILATITLCFVMECISASSRSESK